jgi:hypothetical protein
MRIDIEQLRRQYGDYSDEALLEIRRKDLTEIAQACYDEEVRSRGLGRGAATRPTRDRSVEANAVAPAAETQEPGEAEPFFLDADEPDWLADAAEVYSEFIHHGTPPAQAVRARDVLLAGGIPAHLEMLEDQPAEGQPEPTRQWRVLVPGNLNMQATSVLECEIFNKDFEDQWRAHLQALPDEDLNGADPEVAFGGLIDKLERATRAYKDELARRGINQS